MKRKKQSNAFFISFNKACKLCGFSRGAFEREIRAQSIEIFLRGKTRFLAKSSVEKLIFERAMTAQREFLLASLSAA